jgi:hypothetical protein
MNGTSALVSWPDAALQQNKIERCTLTDSSRIAHQARHIIRQSGGATAELCAVGRQVRQPLGTWPAVRAQQTESDLVHMKPGAHRPGVELKPHPHSRTAEQVCIKFQQPCNIRLDRIAGWAVRQRRSEVSSARSQLDAKASRQFLVSGKILESALDTQIWSGPQTDDLNVGFEYAYQVGHVSHESGRFGVCESVGRNAESSIHCFELPRRHIGRRRPNVRDRKALPTRRRLLKCAVRLFKPRADLLQMRLAVELRESTSLFFSRRLQRQQSILNKLTVKRNAAVHRDAVPPLLVGLRNHRACHVIVPEDCHSENGSGRFRQPGMPSVPLRHLLLFTHSSLS